MDISPQKPNDRSARNNKKVGKTASIYLNVPGAEIEVASSDIKKMAKKYAKIAYSSGETNDEEFFAEHMGEDLYEAYEKTAKKRANPRRGA